jgi:hypothetical protein
VFLKDHGKVPVIGKPCFFGHFVYLKAGSPQEFFRLFNPAFHDVFAEGNVDLGVKETAEIIATEAYGGQGKILFKMGVDVHLGQPYLGV